VFDSLNFYQEVLNEAFAELFDMESHPDVFTLQEVEWRRTSILLFQRMYLCHFNSDGFDGSPTLGDRDSIELPPAMNAQNIQRKMDRKTGF